MMNSQQHTLNTIREGVEDFGIFKAVFMAGSPGSGKSTVKHALFDGLGLKSVDADDVRAAYIKLGKESDYDVYMHMMRRQKQNYIYQRLGIILDTTAWQLPAVMDTVHELRALGYDVAMIHVYAPLHQALQRVEARRMQTGRDVPYEDVVKRYKGLQNNTRDFIQVFGDNYWFVDNSGAQPRTDLIKREVREWLREPPHTEQAQAWIQHQKVSKRR